MNEIVETWKDRIAALGLSLSEVCRQAAIDRSTWHRWQHGQKPRQICINTIEQLLKRLEKSRR